MEANIHSFWHAARIIVLVGLIFYLSFSALLLILQSHMVYYPTRDIERTPDEVGLSYEKVEFTSNDGTVLTGWFVPARAERGVILFCHGNGGNISHRIESIRVFHDLGLSTFIFDYRGYGLSRGRPTEEGTYEDADAAWRYLVEVRRIPRDRIIIFGRSLGGAVASRLANDHTPKILIIESSFTSIGDMGAHLFPWLPVRLLARFHYTTLTYLREVKCPVLVVHSRDDDLIPFAHGRALFEAAPEPKEFLILHGTHNDGFLVSGKSYVDGLNGFVSRYFGL